MTQPYFCIVEYLESTGTQYIDTGVVFNESVSYSWEIYAQAISTGYNDYSWFIGTQTPWTMGGIYGENSQYTFYPTGTYYQNGQSVGITQGNKYGLVKHVVTQTGSSSNIRSISLFSRHNDSDGNSTGGSKRIFSCKISKAGVLIRDFIPVLDNSMRPAMYDRVSQTLFYNQGTDEFNYGRRIIPVEYLESSGTQWIKTDYTLTANTSIDVGFSPLEQPNANLWVIGSYVASNKLTGVRITSGTQIDCYINTTISKTVSGSNKGNKYQAVLDGKWTVNGSEGTAVTPSAGLSPLTLFGWNAAGTANTYNIAGLCSTKIYYCKIWDNGQLVRDFIPVRDENNVGYLFDRISGLLFENAGSGSFVVGTQPIFSGNKKLLRKKLALMLANLKKKRPYYCEVEYLESTGTQYIDTGLLSTANSKVDIVYGFTSMESGAANNSAIFGGRNSATTNTFTFFKIASTTPQFFRFDYNSQPAVGNATQLTWNATSKYRFSYNGSMAKTENINTGESYSANISPGSTYTTSTIVLFAENTNGNVSQFMKGRIYKYWYTDGTNTIDLIPVLDWNGVACMYDKVSGQLFYNQGTGDFTAGREIHPVEYLETLDNTNWITTTFIPTATTNIETKVRCITTSTTLTTWALGASTWWGVHLKDSTQIGIVNGTLAERQAYCPYSVNTDVVLKLDGSNVYADGNLVGSITKASATSTLDLFRYYNASNLYWRGRIYYFKADDNGTQVLDMVCAIDENGVGFMFDKVSHTIYDNAGTGAFAYPARELEYLESDGTQYIDTGKTFVSSTDEIELEYENTSTLTNKWLFGSYESNANIGISSATLSQVTFWYNGNVWGAVSSQYDSEHILRYDSTGMSNDGVNLKAFTSYTGTWNLYLFALNNTGTSPNGYFGYGKIWGYKHTRSGSTLLDLVPAFKDGSAGMLDKANNVFYSNAGTGTFTAGKIVEPEYE